MELRKETIDNKKSNLNLENRNKLVLSGVVEVICFDEKTIVLDTSLGTLTTKGENLKMHKLDVQNGDVVIVGHINSCVYTTMESKKDKDSIIAKLFR